MYTFFFKDRICVYVRMHLCHVWYTVYVCSEQLPDRIFQKYGMKNQMVLVESMNVILFANRFCVCD